MLLYPNQKLCQKMATISQIISVKPELCEYTHELTAIPKVQCISPNYDVKSSLQSFNIIDNDELATLCTLNGTKRESMDIAFVLAPTIQNDETFFYGAEFVPTTDSHQTTKFNYYMYNRLKATHSLLTPSGIVCVQVTDKFLLDTRLLLNDIFGSDNYITTHIIVTNKAGTILHGVSHQHQYILVYSKNKTLSLENVGYDSNGTKCFCYESRFSLDSDDIGLTEAKSRQYQDEISSFDLASNIRTQKRTKNDASFYPIYYLPPMEYSEGGLDWNPILSLSSTGNPNEIIFYPVSDDGKEYKWNTSQNTFLCNYRNSCYCVKVTNGKAKLMVKVRDNVSKAGFKISPMKTVLDKNISSTSMNSQLKKLMGTKDKFYGISPNLVSYLLSGYAPECANVLTIGDKCLTVSIASALSNLNHNIYNVLTEHTNISQLLPAISYENNKFQYVVYTLQYIEENSTFEFIEKTKGLQTHIANLHLNTLVTIEECADYLICETKTGDIVCILNHRYDIEIYREISTKLAKFAEGIYTKTMLYYIDDTSCCHGEHLFNKVEFINLLQNYRTSYHTLKNKLLLKGDI